MAARIHGGPLGRCLTEAYSVANGKGAMLISAASTWVLRNTVWKVMLYILLPFFDVYLCDPFTFG